MPHSISATHQIGSNDGIQTLGLQNHASSHSINKHLVHSDIGEINRNNLCHFIPENHTVALGIALSDHRQQLARPLLSSLKGKPHNPLHTVTGEDRNFSRDLPRFSGVRTATLARILSLAVLTDDHPVKVIGPALAQRRLGAAEYPCWAHVRILLERLADGESQPPQGNMIRDVFSGV